MNKKTIALTLLSLASVFALSTTAVKAEETTSEVNILPGELTISPKDTILFNEYKLTGNYEDIDTTATEGFNLVVTDATGSRNGWTVQAIHEGFSDESDNKLEGVTINLSGGNLSNPYSTNRMEIKPSISIGTGATDVSVASKDSGMGISTHTWEANEINLNIPQNTVQEMYAGNYSTTITWNLIAGPQATDTTPTDEN